MSAVHRRATFFLGLALTIIWAPSAQAKSITIEMNPLTLSIFDVAKNSFVLTPGDYQILAGASSEDTPLKATMHVAE